MMVSEAGTFPDGERPVFFLKEIICFLLPLFITFILL
jgi:hypothetical protein